MIRGTTPEHTFTIPMDASTLKSVRVIYCQGGNKILVKEGSACVLTGNTVKVRLTQADTFLFDYKKEVEIQIRVMTNKGDVSNSEIITETVERCLETEVIR